MATPNMYTRPLRNSVPLVSVISSENEIYHINSRGPADLFSPQGLEISFSEGGDIMGMHNTEGQVCHESGTIIEEIYKVSTYSNSYFLTFKGQYEIIIRILISFICKNLLKLVFCFNFG